jgi:hypothetical protein
MEQPAYTADWSDDDLVELIAMAGRLEADPLDLAACWLNESGLHTRAHNANGDAAGLFQAMPATLRGEHYKGDWHSFLNLSVRQQLHWAEVYYSPHRGHLGSAHACYLATFLPALLSHATEPLFVLCGRFGPHADWYRANSVLDVNHDGWIKVHDLADAIVAAELHSSKRWGEFAARVTELQRGAPTAPELEVAICLDEDDDEPPEAA